MKIINTLSVLFFLLIAVACSSESDTIMNDIEKEVGSSSERVAIFDVSFMSDVLETRSSEAENSGTADGIGNETSISNCYIAALNDQDEVVASFFYTHTSLIQSNKTATINDHMIIKVPAEKLPALRFFAVTNLGEVNKVRLLNCENLSSIKNVVLEEEAPTLLVKVGMSEKYTNYATDLSIKDHANEHNCTSVSIPVYQRSAAIELAQFKVVDSKGKEVKAAVTSLKLLNVKESAKIEGEDDCMVYAESNPYDIINNKYEGYRFYAYDNTSDTKTSLQIKYEVNGVSYSRIYTIKTPTGTGKEYTESVKGGKLYQLYVTVSTSSSDIHFEVKDWILKEINLGTIEGTEVK